jgi:hypothetical protein
MALCHDIIAEQKNAPELPIGRFLTSKSLGGNRVILVDYEVLGLASDGRHCVMIFCLGLHFSVHVLDADCGDDR